MQEPCCIIFVWNDRKIWFIIQNFIAITKSATVDPQQLSQAPSLWLEEHHIAVLSQPQKKSVVFYTEIWIKAFVNKSY